MIHTLGDSHALYTFSNIPNVTTHNKNGLTLKRVGYVEDTVIPRMVQVINPQPNDVLIFCLGEMDIRQFTKIYLEHHSTSNLNDLLEYWVERYLHSISCCNVNGATIAIMSVIPPTSERVHKIYNSQGHHHNPVIRSSGTDEERALYTKRINEIISEKCKKYNWVYFDVYSRFVGKDGMLPDEESDGSVHLGNTEKVKNLLEELKFL